MRHKAWRWGLAAAAASLVVGALAVTPASAASSVQYVALGDSYSAGVGAGGTTSGGSCDRSTNAYSALWSGTHSPASYTSVACSGATTSTVDSSQLSSLSSSTTLVSITVGGNDVGFSSIMETCILEGTSSCVSAVDAAEKTAQTTLPANLDTTFDGISSHAPSARVVVLDYPVFYDLNVSGCIGLSATSRTALDQGINIVDGVISSAAARHGFTFADVRNAFVGHQICDSDPWLHSLNFTDIDESYHPTQAGQADGYLPVFTSAA